MESKFEIEEEFKEGNFEDVLKAAGDDGWFQKRFIIWYFLLSIFASMPNITFLIVMSIPNHWCHVPGRELTNYSIEEWKTITIPKEGELFKKCKMYNHSYVPDILNKTMFEEIDCQTGWEYDKTWFRETIPSEQNWICEKGARVATSFSFARSSEGIGSFIFGQLGDIVGRRPTFFAALIIMAFGRTMSIFTAANYVLFVVMHLLGLCLATTVFTAPMVIALETCSPKLRTTIATVQFISWNISMSLVPFMVWIMQDWKMSMIVALIPCTLLLFSNKFIVESPRWLVNKGKPSKALKELQKIAKVNKRELPEDAALALRAPAKQKPNYGIMSLFSNRQLTKHTILLCITWIIVLQTYDSFLLNVSNLEGNPFINYFLQAFAEIPAYLIGKYSCDRIGRRWTAIFAFSITSIECIPLIYAVSSVGNETVTIVLAFFAKFAIAFCFYTLNLQSMEIFPTCLRQTGFSLMTIASSAFGSLAPYVVYLGTSGTPSAPFIAGSILSAVGAICCLFLPETLNKQLPETIEDAEHFGLDDKFWNFPCTEKSK